MNEMRNKRKMKVMKKFIKLMAKHRYSYAFTVLTIIFICYSFNLYNRYHNLTGANKTITYQEFKQIANEIIEEHECLVELTFINSIENIGGETVYKYEVKPKENIHLISGDTLDISDNYNKVKYNNYIFSDTKLDIERDKLYETKATVTAIECPLLYKEVPSENLFTDKDKTYRVPKEFDELLLNEKHLVNAYVNITVPKFDKSNKVNYNFIDKDLKQEKYESYIEESKDENRHIIENKQAEIKWNFLFSNIAYLIIVVLLLYSYGNNDLNEEEIQ